MADTTQTGLIGRSVPRVEDERLLRGNGSYVDDIHPEGLLEAAFLRSTAAHARITSIDVSAALRAPGVVAVFTGADIATELAPMVFAIARVVPESVRASTGAESRVHPMPAMPTERATYVGQPLAVVIAADRYLAEDAVELIELELEPLPVVVDPVEALKADAVRVEADWDDNLALHYRYRKGDVDEVFATAPVRIAETFRSHRYIASPIETRGVVASPNPFDGTLSVSSSTQTPHQLREFLAGALKRRSDTLRVRAPDVGGGFGPKGAIYPEDLVIPYVAAVLGRPVKWIEDRSEHFLATTHGREQVHEIELAADEDGRILALRDRIVHNCGAFHTLGLVVPYNTLTHLLGPYRVPNVDVEMRAAITNTGVVAPYRGAGRPEAVFAMERAMDRLARAVGQDPFDVRERNMIQPDQLPYTTGLVYRDGFEQVYDDGDYPALLRAARTLIDGPAWEEQAGAHRRIGVGYAAFLEGTGVGPFESAELTVVAGGRVRLATGAASQGQGHRTTLGQIAAETLGVPLASIEVVGGDTDAIATGFGTIASRTLVVAGNAVARAAAELRATVLETAAELTRTDAATLSLVDGGVVDADGTAVMPLADLVGALSAYNPGRPAGAPIALRASVVHNPGPVTYAAAVHAAVVSVDVVTGEVEILRYGVAHDCGRPVNPAIVDGQVLGGVMQGIGGALYEEIVYDAAGQLLTGSFLDYLLPTAGEMPDIRLAHVDVPTRLNALGVKGLGESGAIGPPAAIANAVEDAIAEYGAVVRRCPVSPNRVSELIRTGTQEADSWTES